MRSFSLAEGSFQHLGGGAMQDGGGRDGFAASEWGTQTVLVRCGGGGGGGGVVYVCVCVCVCVWYAQCCFLAKHYRFGACSVLNLGQALYNMGL